MSTHTPGPWRITGKGTIRAGDDWIGHAHWRNAEANARLIAAAPELLEALKMARECISYCRRAHKDAQSGTGVPVEIFLDAAIARAEGKP